MIIKDCIVTLNYFDGIENDPIDVPAGPPTFSMASDGFVLLKSTIHRTWKRWRSAGVTFSGDLPISIGGLGGVTPVLRTEILYGWDHDIVTTLGVVGEYEEFQLAVGIDWRIKIDWLNPSKYISISPQYYIRHILDYPGNYKLVYSKGTLEEDNELVSLMVSTTYFHDKLLPSLSMAYDITQKAHLVKISFAYEPTSFWSYAIGTVFLGGEEANEGFEPFENDDYLYCSVTYKWG